MQQSVDQPQPLPVIHSTLGFLPAIRDVLKTELTRLGRGMMMDTRTDKKAHLVWTVLSQEKGATASFEASSGCGPMMGGKRRCTVPTTNGTASIDVVPARPLFSESTFEIVVNINALNVKGGQKVTCPVCGSICSGNFLNTNWQMQMPPCPIFGKWSLSLPLDKLTEVPMGFTAFWDTRIRNQDRSIALEYHTEMKS